MKYKWKKKEVKKLKYNNGDHIKYNNLSCVSFKEHKMIIIYSST